MRLVETFVSISFAGFSLSGLSILIDLRARCPVRAPMERLSENFLKLHFAYPRILARFVIGINMCDSASPAFMLHCRRGVDHVEFAVVTPHFAPRHSDAPFATDIFSDEEAAYRYVESLRWPYGPQCPNCGSVGTAGRLTGASTRVGMYKCYRCRRPFNVKIGTMLQGSHIPLRYWLQAIYLVQSSSRPVSAFQLHQMLGLTLKSATLMASKLEGVGVFCHRKPSTPRGQQDHVADFLER